MIGSEKSVRATDIELKDRLVAINRVTKVVAITGPNTGGKTAALKGLGIALLMARSGLFIPSTKTPTVPFCPNIFVDIGDDQSLEGNFCGAKIMDCSKVSQIKK